MTVHPLRPVQAVPDPPIVHEHGEYKWTEQDLANRLEEGRRALNTVRAAELVALRGLDDLDLSACQFAAMVTADARLLDRCHVEMERRYGPFPTEAA